MEFYFVTIIILWWNFATKLNRILWSILHLIAWHWLLSYYVVGKFGRWIWTRSSFSDNCRDPSSWEHVPHTSWWHVAHIIIRITLIRVHAARFSYPDYLKEKHTALISMTSERLPQMHPDDLVIRIRLPRSLTEVRKSCTLSQTACHGPRSATCRVKGQDEVTTSHFPRSLHTITYHDLCQPPVGWWWPCHHLVSSWQHKISPHH